MKPYLIDSHAHLQFDIYNNDREAILKRMQEKNIWAINIGTNLNLSRKAIDLAKQYDFLFAVIGLHPIHLFESLDPKEGQTEPEIFEVEKFHLLAQEKKVVGVGECGLDYFHNNDEVEKAKQKEEFKKQAVFAQELKKPLVLHLRAFKNLDAYYDALRIISDCGFNEKSERSGVVHFFSADLTIAREFIKRGFYIAFPGVITFNNFYDKIISELPLDRLLIETDCPYATPVPYRGKRNEPTFVEFVAQKLAAIKNLSVEKVAEATVNNCFNLFNL